MTGKSFLVLSINRERRTYVAEALRPNGDVIVEAMTLGQAEGILRQLRFDALAIDFVGLARVFCSFLTISAWITRKPGWLSWVRRSTRTSSRDSGGVRSVLRITKRNLLWARTKSAGCYQ